MGTTSLWITPRHGDRPWITSRRALAEPLGAVSAARLDVERASEQRLYSGAMSAERAAQFEDNWRVFDEVVAYTKELAGTAATYDLGYVENGQIGIFDVEPINPLARRINVIAEYFFIVTVGDNGGRWEMSYSEDDVRLGRRIIAATVAGRVHERSAFGRSQAVVTLDGGGTVRETGYSGCASLFVPQPGWTRWGRLTEYEPYQKP
jgi:hypothetical protein